jgi:short-subunit dehydrogenase
MAQILITGATGLIGRHLVPELRRRGHEVTAVVRGGREVDGATVVDGDVCQPGLGLEVKASEFDAVVHLAAVYDLLADEDHLLSTNVGGVENLLAWLGSDWGGVLHHISSVAIAGDFSGRLEEDGFDVGQGFANPYHRSKFEAEKRVRDSGLRTRIYRPSAVVGDSKTGAIDRADGPYFLFPALKRARDVYPRWMPLPNTLEGRINMVPVDWVARAMAHWIDAGEDGQTYHLVDPEPPYAGDTWNLLSDAAGGPPMRGSLSRWKKRVPFVFDTAGGLGMVRFYGEQRLRDLGVPPQVKASFNQKVKFGAASHDSLPENLRCPPQSAYVAPIWDYWLRNLDSDLDPIEAARTKIEGKVVLITGGSSGVGAELAVQCGAAGATVLLAARREAELTAVAERVRTAGGTCAWRVTDLNEVEECDALVAWAQAEAGQVDILVNNAARSIRRPAAESLERYHDFERVMKLNFFAPVRLIRGVLPGMRERGDGVIVNVLTAGITLPTPYFAAYGASKSALHHLTDTLSAEHLHEGVHVMSVLLPWVRTAMMDQDRYGDTKAMTADKAAAWMLDGIVRRKRRVVNGTFRRRWAINVLAPAFMTRALSIVTRVYADEPSEHPEFEADRALLKRFFKGPLV